MIIPKKRVISSNDIALGIRTIYLNFNLLTIAKTKCRNRKMWKFFFISPIYPICEKKGFISPILSILLKNRFNTFTDLRAYKKVLCTISYYNMGVR